MPQLEKLKLHEVGRRIDDGLIDDLERAIEQARAGDVIGYALVKIRPDHSFSTISLNKGGPLELIGALAVAVFDEIERTRVE